MILSCSKPKELGKGSFNIQNAQAHHRSNIYPIVKLDKETFSFNEPITGQLYLNDETMFHEIANELNLKYSRTYYYFPNEDYSNRQKIGEGSEKIEFKITPTKRMKNQNPGTTIFGIYASFINTDTRYDTAFLTEVEIKWE